MYFTLNFYSVKKTVLFKVELQDTQWYIVRLLYLSVMGHHNQTESEKEGLLPSYKDVSMFDKSEYGTSESSQRDTRVSTGESMHGLVCVDIIVACYSLHDIV